MTDRNDKSQQHAEPTIPQLLENADDVRRLLQSMHVSSSAFVDADGNITGYKVKTGALHRLFGMFGVETYTGLPEIREQQAEPVGDERDMRPLQGLLFAYEDALQEEDEEAIAPARQALIAYLKPIIAAQSGQRAGVAEEWQPIETAPEGNTFIAYHPAFANPFWVLTGTDLIGGFTHWLPIPAAPTQQQEPAQ